MTEYQELFNKISKEIFSKRKSLPILKKQIEESEEKYNNLFEEITDIQKNLTTKQEELEKMPYKYDNKIFYKVFIPGALIACITGVSLALLSINLITYFQIVNTFIDILLDSLVGILGIILPSITSAYIIKNIFKKLAKKSHDKIMSSSEYQELLKEIKQIDYDLSVKKSLQRTEENLLDEMKKEYNLALTEIKMKEALLEYLRNENKILTPTNKKPDSAINEDIKVPKRTRKKD